MKTASLVARVLLGLLFTIFGLNGFFNFIPMGPMPGGLAGQFIGALAQSHYMAVVFTIELVCGILLLVNLYAPLALTMLGPVIVNIILFHAFMAPSGLPLAGIACLLWLLTAYGYREAFRGLLVRGIGVRS